MLRPAFTALVLTLSVHSVLAAPVFKPESRLPAGHWVDQSEDLCAVAEATRDYLALGPAYDPDAIHGGLDASVQAPVARIKATLDYICQIWREDQRSGQSRLSDPAFIEREFELLRWHPDRRRAAELSSGKPLLERLPEDRLLLTKYYVRLAEGSSVHAAETPHALHGLPYDEAHLSLEDADARANQLTRYRYGKQAILTGILEQQRLAPVLVWLSRADLEGALLQGTAVVEMAQQRRYFNVHRNNGIAYDRTQRPESQERYWYFKEVDGVLGYGKDAHHKIPVRPGVTVAGDVFQLGLGRLILLRTEEHGQPTFRLTILADTGGAFHDNLYQLDWLSGYYRDWNDYHAHNRHISDYAQGWLLLKRKD